MQAPYENSYDRGNRCPFTKAKTGSPLFEFLQSEGKAILAQAAKEKAGTEGLQGAPHEAVGD